MSEKKAEKKKLKKSTKVVLIVASVILALVMIAMIAVVLFGKSLLNLMPRLGEEETLSQAEIDALQQETDPYDPNFTGPYYNSGELDMSGPADKLPENENIIHVLLVGQDRREGQGRQRSDAMILCTINLESKTLTMTSFMRDLWVRIPGYYDERLNASYAIGGFNLLNKTLEYQFGVHADYNVEVDFSGFTAVIDAVGGIDIYLTSSEAYTLNQVGGNFSEGMNHLTGEQALAYSRIRKLDSDFNRTNRQRTVLTALIEQMRGKSATELYSIAQQILPMVTTDMKDTQILNLLMKVAPILSELQVVSQRIPIDDAYNLANIDGKSVILLKPDDLEKNRQFIINSLSK